MRVKDQKILGKESEGAPDLRETETQCELLLGATVFGAELS